jgi:mRNA interferase YafQ
MITTINRTRSFKRDTKRIVKTLGLENTERMIADILTSIITGSLQPKHRDHSLTGEWQGCRDCHVKSDLLIIYEIINDTLTLHRLGSHSELF